MEDPQLPASASDSIIIQVDPTYGLHRAAEQGDLELINRLLANLADDDGRYRLFRAEDENGKLPLHLAAQSGHVDALQLLLPEKIGDRTDLQDLVDAQTRKEGQSALHLAAAHGHTKLVQWLFAKRRADVNLMDQEGNTPLHLAILNRHREVVRYLVTEGHANLYVLNNGGMMPVSFCKDQAMFDALFFTFTGSFNKGGTPIQQDANKRTILHYAAQFASNPEAIVKLIVHTDPEIVYVKDRDGDSFLHVAAKSGNVSILHALKKLRPGRVDVNRLLSNGRHDYDALHGPGIYALLYNHRDFFNELVTMGYKVEITLRCIIRWLIVELYDKPEIQHRLALFASTLPTYLALYAKKYCIFDFLLETKLLSLSQWDDEYKRTCLHWAVLDNRTDIVKKLCRRKIQQMPGIQDADGKTALQHAFEQNNHMLMETLRNERIFKEHEEKLQKDREVYVQVHNAILVGAALIASVTFAGWLQLPSGANFKTSSLKIFWASNCISFFTAVATMCVTTTALIPTPSRYVGDIVNQLRVAIVIDAGLLAISLAAVMWAFAAAGFAALHQAHIFTYQAIMRSTVAVGGFLCLIVWIAFVLQFYRCAPPKSVLFALLLPSLPFNSRWWPASLQTYLRSRIGDSSHYGYPIKLRSEIKEFMDRDLVAYHAKQLTPSVHVPPPSESISLDTMKQLLGKLDISDKDRFIEDTYKQIQEEIAHKKVISCGTSNLAA